MNEKVKEMMSMEMLENILGKERMEALAEAALKDHLNWLLNDRSRLERILYDVAYKSALAFIAEEHGEDLRKQCVKAIRRTINKNGDIGYYMFSDNPKGRAILNDELENARPYMQDAIRKTMDKYTIQMTRSDIEDMIWSCLVSRIFREESKEIVNFPIAGEEEGSNY